ncbi:MAG: hypothetical protein LT102_16745 [Burkholderiaceae bacterium]|nr:hypothetical protein [Burkholderiaceae bacterium]
MKLQDKVGRQAGAAKGRQSRIEDLAARVIRLEARMEMVLHAVMRRLPGG